MIKIKYSTEKFEEISEKIFVLLENKKFSTRNKAIFREIYKELSWVDSQVWLKNMPEAPQTDEKTEIVLPELEKDMTLSQYNIDFVLRLKKMGNKLEDINIFCVSYLFRFSHINSTLPKLISYTFWICFYPLYSISLGIIMFGWS